MSNTLHKMKPYDLVISDSLAELIETTNEAYTFGYLPVGGMIYIESQEKFIQTIIKLKTKNTMNTFFQELAKAMKDSESITLKITKTGGDLTVLSTSKGKKDLIATGTPEEMDTELIQELIKVPVRDKFKAVISEVEIEHTEKEEKEEENEEEKPKTEKKTITKKETKAKSVKGKTETSTDVSNEPLPEVKNDVEANVSKVAESKTEDKHPNATAAVEKAHIEGAKATEAKKEAVKNENAFKVFMIDGKRLMTERKYSEALASFEQACSINPENEEAQTECAKAGKWVKMVADL